jgi:predicted Zn-dependent protease
MKGRIKQIGAIVVTIVLGLVLTVSGCKKGVNFFSIQDDKDFGAQMEAEIAANPQQYPLLSQSQYPAAYAYLENMKQQILASGKLEHANDFAWKLYIVNDPTVQNAFCTPGGYIYVYTGLIKYLDNASSLAGVIGHEMAHADRRHSTKQMTEQYGLSLMFGIIAGTTGQAQITEIVANLSSLAFSRADEKDADTHSVIYLCPTQYRANGAADFFEKIIASGAQQPPAFLSTHPNPDNRVNNIKTEATERTCGGNPTTQVEITDYNSFKNSLPN